MPTQMPPSGAQTVLSAVQSPVHRPLPTPPGLTAERLSLDLMQVKPAPHSAFPAQAAPSFEPGVPPPVPPVPLPPVPLVVVEVDVLPPAPWDVVLVTVL